MVEIGFRDLRAAKGDHIAYFWETEEEFREAVSFLEPGLNRDDEHAVVFGYDEANARVLNELKEKGYSPEDLQKQRRLSILAGESSGESLLEQIAASFDEAMDAGATMIRLLGNIGWHKPEWPDEQEILRFEAKVTAAASDYPCVVICMYDVRSLSGSVVIGAFGTHPLTIYHNLIRKNPICEGVDEFLSGLDGG